MLFRSLLLVLLLPLLLPNCNVNAVSETKPVTQIVITDSRVKYDLSFKHWGEFYFPFEDWHWWKSQGMAESNLDPNAMSYCGAVGIMQIMPATATDLGVKNRWDAEESIQGGIKYDSQVDRIFKTIDQPERRKFMFAGYNAGPGNIQRAKRLANSTIWDDVSDSLPLVTGKHSTETINYVRRIHKVKETL